MTKLISGTHIWNRDMSFPLSIEYSQFTIFKGTKRAQGRHGGGHNPIP